MRKPKPLIDRLSKTLLKQLATRKVTNAEAAEKLGVTETYLSRVVASLQKKEPGKTVIARKANHTLAKTRHDFRVKLAKEVIRKRKTCDEAAAEAGCSLRTIFRYVEKYRPAKDHP